MSKDLSKRAREIVAEIRYITIASVTPDGEPWNSPVFGAYDNNYNFYFGTHKDSQKAKNIRSNNNVFLAIYNSTVPPGAGEGVYIEGKAQQLTDIDEIKYAYEIMKKRHDDHFWEFTALDGSGPINVYKVEPNRVWMNDSGQKDGYYIDIRTSVKLLED
jgi:general stress protein 26